MVDFLHVQGLYSRPHKSYHQLVATAYKTHNLQTNIDESLDLSYSQTPRDIRQNLGFDGHSCTTALETSPRVS